MKDEMGLKQSFEIGDLISHDAFFGNHKVFGRVVRTEVDGHVVYLNDGKEEHMMNRGELQYRLNACTIDVEHLLQEANRLATENSLLKEKLSRITHEATLCQ